MSLHDLEIYSTLYFKVLYMENKARYIQELAEIRHMMDRSSKFLSLTGWSGIMAGLYALIALYLFKRSYLDGGESIVSYDVERHKVPDNIFEMIVFGLVLFAIAVGTAIFLSQRKAKKREEKIWNSVTKRLVIEMAIPLLSGGGLVLIIIFHGIYTLIVPALLIFYGLSLISASRYTVGEVKYLGLMEIIFGLICALFPSLGLVIWGIGFGILHIIYGFVMHWRYER